MFVSRNEKRSESRYLLIYYNAISATYVIRIGFDMIQKSAVYTAYNI